MKIRSVPRNHNLKVASSNLATATTKHTQIDFQRINNQQKNSNL